MPLDEEHLPSVLELLARANKQLTLGGFEYDLDREFLVFRITNLFEREKYDSDIISSMVHCAIAELDRITPYAAIVRDTPGDLLDDLDLGRLLMRRTSSRRCPAMRKRNIEPEPDRESPNSLRNGCQSEAASPRFFNDTFSSESGDSRSMIELDRPPWNRYFQANETPRPSTSPDIAGSRP